MKHFYFLFFLIISSIGFAQKEATPTIFDESLAYEHFSSAYLLLKLGRYQQAIEEYEKAIILKKDFVDAYFNLAFLYKKNKQYQKAITYYKKVIALEKDNDLVYFYLANIYKHTKKYQLAVKFYKKALTLKNQDNEIYIHLGSIYYALTEYKQAVLYYQKALKIQSKTMPVYAMFNLAHSYERLKQYQKSLNIFNKINQLVPNSIAIMSNIALLLVKLKKSQSAIVIYNKLLKKDAKEVDFYYGLIDALSLLNKQPEIIKAYQKLLKLETNKLDLAYIYFGISQAHIKLKQHQLAIKSYQKILEFSPQDYQVWTNLANIYYDLKDYDKAISLYKKALSIYEDGLAYINLFELSLVLNKPFDTKLMTKFTQNFKDEKQLVMFLDMFKVLKNISQNKLAFDKKAQNVFLKKYPQNKNNKKMTFYWKSITIWIAKQKNKTQLLTALDFFKKW